jgi:hypothetical protein
MHAVVEEAAAMVCGEEVDLPLPKATLCRRRGCRYRRHPTVRADPAPGSASISTGREDDTWTHRGSALG